MAIPDVDIRLSEACNQTTGEPEWPATAVEVNELKREVYEYVFQTEVGKRFADTYEFDERAQARIEAEFVRRFGEVGSIGKPWPGVPLSGRLVEILNDLMVVRDRSLTLIMPPEPEIPPVERARDSRGRFVNEIAQEVQDDLNGSTSTAEIKEKLRTSPEYRAAWEKAHTPEVSQAVSASNDLRAFADVYIRTPADKLKFSPSGLVTIGDKVYNRKEFENVVTQATAAGLI